MSDTERPPDTVPENELPVPEEIDIGETIIAQQVSAQLSAFLEAQGQRDERMMSMLQQVIDRNLVHDEELRAVRQLAEDAMTAADEAGRMARIAREELQDLQHGPQH